MPILETVHATNLFVNNLNPSGSTPRRVFFRIYLLPLEVGSFLNQLLALYSIHVTMLFG